MFLTFFEPDNSEDISIHRKSTQFIAVMTSELIILIYFIIDMMLRLQYMYIAGKRLGFWNVFTDENFLIHFACEIMMIVDAILFYSIYPNAYFRFGRIFRAIKAVLESKEVYRTTISVLH